MSGGYRNKIGFAAILSSFLILLMAVNTYAAVSASLDIGANSIQVGEQIQFNIVVNGTTNASQPDVRPIAGLNIQYYGPSTSVQIINMQTSSSITFQYLITGTKAGQYTLGPYTVRAEGRPIKTNSIQLSVGGGGGSSGQNNQNDQVDESDTQGPMGDQVFLTMEVPKTTIYNGERIPINLKLYSSISLRYSLPVFEQADFAVIEGINEGVKSKGYVNSQPYNIITFSAFLSPIKTGTFSLSPKSTCYIQSEDSMFGHFFSDNFDREVEVRGKKVTLHVLPLPESGKPKDFSGGVGNFQFNVSAAPTEVLQGDPITLKMTVSGEGNLPVIAAPRFANTTGFKVYDAQRKSNGDQNSEVTFEQVVIPLDPNIKQLGPFTLNYFNTATGRYQQLTQSPIPVTVKPNPNFKAGANWGNGNSSQTEQVGQDLVFIKDHPGALEPLNDRLDRKLWFWLLQLLPLLGLAAAFRYRKRLEFLQADTAHSRAIRASSAANRRLAKIKTLLASGEHDNLLEELHQTLRGYLGEKFKLAAAGMTGDVVEALKTKTIPEETLAQIREFFSQYDFFRFTGAQVDPETAGRLTDLTVAIITALDRHQPGRANTKLPSIMYKN